MLRRLGLEEEMMRRQYPIKQGVKVYGTSAVNSWYVRASSRDENWNLYDNITWQVRRSDFEAMMLEEAVKRGAELRRGTAIKALKTEDDAVRGILFWWPDGETEEIEAKVTLDCSGQPTFLSNQKVTGPKYVGSYDKQVAFFSHVKGAIRDTGISGEDAKDNTLILYQNKFQWAWFIPVDQDIASIGLVMPRADFLAKKQTPEEFFRSDLFKINPELPRRTPNLELVENVHVVPNYSYQVRGFCGKSFICLGDSHRFIDPIFRSESPGRCARRSSPRRSCAIISQVNGETKKIPSGNMRSPAKRASIIWKT